MSEVVSPPYAANVGAGNSDCETAYEARRRHSWRRPLAALALTGALAGGPLAAEAGAKAPSIIPNRIVYNAAGHYARKIASIIVREYKQAPSRDRWRGEVADAIGGSDEVRDAYDLAVAVPARAKAAGRKEEYVLQAFFPDGSRLKAADTLGDTVSIYRTPVAAAKAVDPDVFQQPQPPVYYVHLQHDTEAYYNSPSSKPSTNATWARTLDWSLTVDYGNKQLPLGWESFDGNLFYSLDPIVSQEVQELHNAVDHAPITPPKVLCSAMRVPQGSCVIHPPADYLTPPDFSWSTS